jgi:hypothetical protein
MIQLILYRWMLFLTIIFFFYNFSNLIQIYDTIIHKIQIYFLFYNKTF